MEEIEDGIIVNLLASLVISLLISIEQQIPPHKRKVRAVQKVREAIRELAQLNSLPLTEELVHSGVKIWNKCIEELQTTLENICDEINEPQLELFHYDRNNVLYYTTYTTTPQIVTEVQDV